MMTKSAKEWLNSLRARAFELQRLHASGSAGEQRAYHENHILFIEALATIALGDLTPEEARVVAGAALRTADAVEMHTACAPLTLIKGGE